MSIDSPAIAKETETDLALVRIIKTKIFVKATLLLQSKVSVGAFRIINTVFLDAMLSRVS